MPLHKQMRACTRALAVILAAGSMAGGTLAAGISSAGAASPASAKTLNLAFGADMQVPDPDIFYEIEGNAVVTSVYEGLVKYANNSTKIVPALATSWSESPDGMTYTFQLRSGVKFHDGTPFNSAAAEFSFQRRKGVNSAPAYMLADVSSMSSPDPLTFVVHLNKPVSAFLDYLASPYGPKMVSPTLVKAHEVGAASPVIGRRSGSKTHDAGTGPYTISAFDEGSHYDLSRVLELLGNEAVLHDGGDRDRPRRLHPADRAAERAALDDHARPAGERRRELPEEPGLRGPVLPGTAEDDALRQPDARGLQIRGGARRTAKRHRQEVDRLVGLRQHLGDGLDPGVPGRRVPQGNGDATTRPTTRPSSSRR